MTPGILAAFFLLLGQFYGPVQQLSGIVDSWQQATASGKHINALLATEETENIEPSSITPTTGALRLEALTFRYPEETQPALDNLSLTIPPGTVVAVVGRSGAGKSTLIKLLAGLYSPTRGQIRIGERLINAASLRDYRRQTGLVTRMSRCLAAILPKISAIRGQTAATRRWKSRRDGRDSLKLCNICRWGFVLRSITAVRICLRASVS